MYIFRPGASDAAGYTMGEQSTSDTGIQLPTARHLWPGGGGGGVDVTHALALVYNEAEARPVTGLDGIGDAGSGPAARPRRARPAFVAICRVPTTASTTASTGEGASSSPLAPAAPRTGKHSVSSWVRRQYPPSPLLSRAWGGAGDGGGGGGGAGRLLELREGGELAGVLEELLEVGTHG